jgi:hypothetical protein
VSNPSSKLKCRKVHVIIIIIDHHVANFMGLGDMRLVGLQAIALMKKPCDIIKGQRHLVETSQINNSSESPAAHAAADTRPAAVAAVALHACFSSYAPVCAAPRLAATHTLRWLYAHVSAVQLRQQPQGTHTPSAQTCTRPRPTRVTPTHHLPAHKHSSLCDAQPLRTVTTRLPAPKLSAG